MPGSVSERPTANGPLKSGAIIWPISFSTKSHSMRPSNTSRSTPSSAIREPSVSPSGPSFDVKRGMSQLAFNITSGVAVLRFDNPPVNSFGLEMRGLVLSALARAETDPAVGAVILTGSGKGFSGGADIREFGTPKAYAEPNLRTLLRAIEECSKPVIAAIEGICMGGGVEMALACHYRVAGRSARLALPEVKLGLLPGAGGTQRLPRVIGVEAALNMIVSGAQVGADQLRDTALFDVLSEGDLLASAADFARA